MTVVTLKAVPVSGLPADLPAALRRLADKVEQGLVTEMVIGYCEQGDYCFEWPSSLHDSIVLCAMLQQSAIDRMRR